MKQHQKQWSIRPLRTIPRYSVRLWNCRQLDDRALVIRPGSGIVLRRAMLAATMLLITILMNAQYLAAVDLINNPPPEPALSPQFTETERKLMETARDTLSPEQYTELTDKLEGRRKDREARHETSRYRRHMILYWGRNFLAVGFLAIGALPLLSTIWNRVLIERDTRGNLVVRSWIWIPRTTSWPMDQFDRIAIGARERVGHDEHRRVVRHGWFWTVQLGVKGQPSMPVVANIAFIDEKWGPQFLVGRVRKRPLTGEALPMAVDQLAEALHQITGLPIAKPEIVETRASGGASYTTESGLTLFTGPETVSERTYDSLDEMPPQVRAQMEQMMKEAGPDGIVRKQHIVIRDESGRKRTYENWDDLPDEWKSRIPRR